MLFVQRQFHQNPSNMKPSPTTPESSTCHPIQFFPESIIKGYAMDIRGWWLPCLIMLLYNVYIYTLYVIKKQGKRRTYWNETMAWRLDLVAICTRPMSRTSTCPLQLQKRLSANCHGTRRRDLQRLMGQWMTSITCCIFSDRFWSWMIWSVIFRS